MIVKSIALSVAKCLECNSLLIYKIDEGLPQVCNKCGTRINVELNQQQRQQMERMQQQQQSFNIPGGPGGAQSFTIRF